MAKVGRNEPCPCGSGRKYKKCCLTRGSGSGAPYTAADRHAALQKLLHSIHPDDLDGAREMFWGKHFPLRARWTDAALLEMVEVAFQFWLLFDERSAGLTLAEDVLEGDRDPFDFPNLPALRDGERRYLEMARRSSMRLYEVIGVAPGASITLRDLLQGGEVRVRERAGSRCVHTWDLVAARVVQKGASGEPEIDGGIFPIQPRLRDPLVKHLARLSAELREALVPVFVDAWIGPGLPALVNYDGDPLISTQVHFDVLDEGKLVVALDRARSVTRGGEELVWSWVGSGAQRRETVSRAFLRIERGRLEVQTNSRERGEAAKALVERLAGASVKYRVTERQDLEQAMLAQTRDGGGEIAAVPPDELRQAAVQLLQQHYEAWLDEPVPALDGATPRAAAAVDALRPRVAELIEGLERLYERALAEGSAAFDPTWMWEALQIEELAHRPAARVRGGRAGRRVARARRARPRGARGRPDRRAPGGRVARRPARRRARDPRRLAAAPRPVRPRHQRDPLRHERRRGRGARRSARRRRAAAAPPSQRRGAAHGRGLPPTRQDRRHLVEAAQARASRLLRRAGHPALHGPRPLAPRGAELDGREAAVDRAVLARTERGRDRRAGVPADIRAGRGRVNQRESAPRRW
ncbi:uncharacterized protein SOCE836_041050 [Sorangium cellulosum]|uniref:Uncharacterized protein n=1 Tax=Sorangium cellulosum TaxID=56 RepID=A0A4P2QP99_SORCE|nr:uncharacterized protein SOCE836_041050 [Sorangium cellulosum]WCQ91342.1 hypothetical protein NQZ70_04060 [Sorangium sp. Soce836]